MPAAPPATTARRPRQPRRLAARVTAATTLLACLPALADSACWREPLLIGRRVAGLAAAYQLWERPRGDPGEPRAADALPLADAIPSFAADGRRAAVLACGQIETRVNGDEATCTGLADQDDGTLWVAVIEGPVRGRVRVPLKAGGSAWVAFRPEPEPAAAPGANPTVEAASLARHGLPGQLVVATDQRVDATLWPLPRAQGRPLAWTSAQEAQARAFALRAAPALPAPNGHWLTQAALYEGGQWQLVSQVVRTERTPQGQWWRVRQWLQPMTAIDPATVADGRDVLALDGDVRSPTLREGWVRHRDDRGVILAVITDGAACD
jgi:hypothetical protein